MLLHLIWTHWSHISQHRARWFFATGLQHKLQGYLTLILENIEGMTS